MPPYSGSATFSDDHYDRFALKSLTYDSNDVALPSPPPLTMCSAPSTDSQDSVFDKLLDSNLCKAPTNPFKTRKCSECGRDCSKFQGYRKEKVFDDDGKLKKKTYYHKCCYQIKQYRDQHKLRYDAVMDNLVEQVRNLEREKQLRAMMLAAQQAEKEAKEKERLRRSLLGLEDDDENDNISSKRGAGLSRISTKKSIRMSKKKLKKSLKRVKGSITSSSNKNNNKIWDEYTDSTTGNKYYFDGVVTTWDKPKTGKIRKE